MKTASFHVRATERQSLRWKRAAEAEGHASAGTWIAEAVDRYLDALQRAGRPLPLVWHRGRFRVELQNGEVEMPGFLSLPFGAFRGTSLGRGARSCQHFTLVHTPSKRILATLRTLAHCKALASELARVWVKWKGVEPAEDPAPLLQRFQREDV